MNAMRVTLTGRHVRIVSRRSCGSSAALLRGRTGPGHEDLWRYLFTGPYRGMRHPSSAYLDQRLRVQRSAVFTILGGNRGADLVDASANAHRADTSRDSRSEIFCICLAGAAVGLPNDVLLARGVRGDGISPLYEWNAMRPQRAFAPRGERLGFTFAHLPAAHDRQGKNRDTAWFSMLDTELPARKGRFEKWLDPANFTVDGPAEEFFEWRASLDGIDREVYTTGTVFPPFRIDSRAASMTCSL